MSGIIGVALIRQAGDNTVDRCLRGARFSPPAPTVDSCRNLRLKFPPGRALGKPTVCSHTDPAAPAPLSQPSYHLPEPAPALAATPVDSAHRKVIGCHGHRLIEGDTGQGAYGRHPAAAAHLTARQWLATRSGITAVVLGSRAPEPMRPGLSEEEFHPCRGDLRRPRAYRLLDLTVSGHSCCSTIAGIYWPRPLPHPRGSAYRPHGPWAKLRPSIQNARTASMFRGPPGPPLKPPVSSAFNHQVDARVTYKVLSFQPLS